MKRSIVLLCSSLLLSVGATAQYFSVESALFKTGTSPGGAILQAPVLATNQTFWFPTTGGTLLTTANFGGWLVGGQDLSGLGLLGSTNANDVSFIAGGLGNIRLTIMNSVPAVMLPTQTELRFGDVAGGEYSSIKSPATLPSNINYTLPNYLPTEIGQRIQVEAVSGSDVTLGYTTEEISTDVSFDTKSNATETDNTTIDVPDMAITVLPNKTYAFEALVSVQHNAGANANAEISFSLPAGASLHYYHLELTLNNPQATGNQTEAIEVFNAPPAPGEQHYILKGFVRTNGAGGTVQMRLASTSANIIRLTENSYMQITTN